MFSSGGGACRGRRCAEALAPKSAKPMVSTAKIDRRTWRGIRSLQRRQLQLRATVHTDLRVEQSSGVGTSEEVGHDAVEREPLGLRNAQRVCIQEQLSSFYATRHCSFPTLQHIASGTRFHKRA